MCPAAIPAHDRYGFIIKLLWSKIGCYPGAGKGTVTDILGTSHTSLMEVVEGVSIEEHSLRNQNEGWAGSGYDVSPNEIDRPGLQYNVDFD